MCAAPKEQNLQLSSCLLHAHIYTCVYIFSPNMHPSTHKHIHIPAPTHTYLYTYTHTITQWWRKRGVRERFLDTENSNLREELSQKSQEKETLNFWPQYSFSVQINQFLRRENFATWLITWTRGWEWALKFFFEIAQIVVEILELPQEFSWRGAARFLSCSIAWGIMASNSET